jgi:hypothetical protein
VKGPALLALAAGVAGAFVFWRARRGSRDGAEAWAEEQIPGPAGQGHRLTIEWTVDL